METKEAAQKEINLLELVPERNIEWEKDNEGFVVLLKPKIQHPFFQKHILSKFKRPHYKVKLDEIGSFFWKHCDGSQTVNAIAGRMEKHFGDKIDPLYDRMTLFLQHLEKNKFIKWKER
ncbi:PqqD family protein [Acidobacteriota bacterium]